MAEIGDDRVKVRPARENAGISVTD